MDDKKRNSAVKELKKFRCLNKQNYILQVDNLCCIGWRNVNSPRQVVYYVTAITV